MARLLVLGLSTILVAMVSMASSRQAKSADVVPSCGSVNDQLNPCLPYITNSADSPTSACCDGVNKVNNLAPTKQDLIAVCNCIKAELPQLGKTTNSSRIAHLPHQCGVNRDFPPVDPNYDCTQFPFSLWL